MTIIAVSKFIRQINTGTYRHQRHKGEALRTQHLKGSFQKRTQKMLSTCFRSGGNAHKIRHQHLLPAQTQHIGIYMQHRAQLFFLADLVKAADNHIVLAAVLLKIVLKERLRLFFKAVIPKLLCLIHALLAQDTVNHKLPHPIITLYFFTINSGCSAIFASRRPGCPISSSRLRYFTSVQA